MSQVFSPEPDVVLINYFELPYENSIAAARTCYSSKVIFPEDIRKTEKSRALGDTIFKSIYEAGHHTTVQHPTFQFILRNVSRQFVWSFLHSHTFYNSEQVSQRYVEVKPENFITPPIQNERARRIYVEKVRMLMDAYHRLIEVLMPAITQEYFKIYPGRRYCPDKWSNAIKKKALEAARYVLPIGSTTFLYHTISGVTLYRYWKMCNVLDVPAETRLVVGKMKNCVSQISPEFFKHIEDPIPLEETVEYRLMKQLIGKGTAKKKFFDEFDSFLGCYRSKLVDYKPNAENVLAMSVRAVFGKTRDELSDEEAIRMVTDPKINGYLDSRLNVNTHSKISRVLFHPSFTFAKKLSHTADSQDQRHRMTPGSRPLMIVSFDPDYPDYILPPIFERVAEANEIARSSFNDVWKSINDMMSDGVPFEFAQYLLPNAVPIRFLESGDLLNLYHKWILRLCLLAQEEIWRCCLEELIQVKEKFPNLVKYVHAPCFIRKHTGTSPYCPEGNRYCGVPVWTKPVEALTRLL